MARYEAGETLSSIARTYDCSPPAISYIVNRSRARQPGSTQVGPAQLGNEPSRPAVTGEAQLIKAAANGAEHREPSVNRPVESPLPQPALVRRPPEAQPSPQADQRPAHGNGNGNGFERPHWAARDAHPSVSRPFDPRAADLFPRSPSSGPRAAESQPLHHAAPHAPTNVDHRARLHLQLGNGTNPIGASHSNDPRNADRQHSPAPQQASSGNGEPPPWSAPDRQQQPGPAEPQHRPAPPNHQQSAPNRQAPPQQHGNGHVPNGGHSESRKEHSGSFIDSELRARVDADIAAFLAAFDAALAQDTPETRGALRDATDRLLRAGARTRIELERLEARLPMPARDSGRPAEAWRQR
ncbi:MAG: hypothetical protein JO162_00180 [Alphaproteobacteria bacterium]|nr:hypothetical protein [Alphaproteobacteria bacterium]